MLSIPNKKQVQQQEKHQERDNKEQPPIGIPYIKGISEPIQRVFRKHGVSIYHKPINTIRQLLVHPKDKTNREQKTGVIYQIDCETCKGTYIGETARTLGKRLDEHKKLPSSAVKEHQESTGHNIDWKNVKIVGKEEHWMKRKIKEAITIRRVKPSLNRDQGWDLPPIFCNLLSHDLTLGSHVTNWASSDSWRSPCEMGESSMVSQITDLCVRKLTQYELPKVRIKPSQLEIVMCSAR